MSHGYFGLSKDDQRAVTKFRRIQQLSRDVAAPRLFPWALLVAFASGAVTGIVAAVLL